MKSSVDNLFFNKEKQHEKGKDENSETLSGCCYHCNIPSLNCYRVNESTDVVENINNDECCLCSCMLELCSIIE